jgi:hypothetical protein
LRYYALRHAEVLRVACFLKGLPDLSELSRITLWLRFFQIIGEVSMTDQPDNSYKFVPSEYNAAMQLFISVGVRALMEAQGGAYSLASRESVNQLPDYRDPPNDDQTPQGRLIEATFDGTISKSEIINGDFEGIVVDMARIAVELEAQISEAMIAHFVEESKRAGNLVSSEIAYDSIIEVLERIDFSFDENGSPNLSFIVAPEAIQSIRTLGKPTPEQQKRFDEIIARRKEEWDARRRNRRLSSRSD